MTRPTACCSPLTLGGRLVGLLVLTVILLGAVAGSSFSTHVGMSVVAPGVSDRHQDHASAPTAADPEARAGEPATVAALVPTSPETQHLMHVLGACLALLAVAAVLLLVLRQLRGLGRGLVRDLRPLQTPAAALTRLFTPPDPPTSTTVLRI